MKMTHYRQCLLERRALAGVEQRVSWLPARFAVQGETLKLRQHSGGMWSDGWRVVMAYVETLPEYTVVRNSRDYLHQREASDI
jgi:hypothetical protein